jgi:peptidoglycan/xylan/chitin deacetylase (PgdA/CDA1 family)
MARLCAVSVDLDEIPNYFRIHGLPEPSWPARNAVYDLGVDRLLTMAKDASLPLTLFAVGADLTWPDAAKRLRAAREAGHEIANHSLDHRYDLTKLGRDAIRSQVLEGAREIEQATGEAPVGFRAPGYTVTDELFGVLEELGVAYDSSVFPCPPYYAAKGAAMTAMLLSGRVSQSILDTPRVLTAPTRPYRVGKPYWKKGKGMLELPIQVTRWTRLPFIGTTLTMAGPTTARMLATMCVGEPLINLELHGIDVLDTNDGLAALAPYQTDVRVPKEKKLESLHAAYDVLRKAGYAFVTLREAARALS